MSISGNNNPATKINEPTTGLAGTVALPPEKRNLGFYLRGDLGFIPVMVTLFLIAAFFQYKSNGIFLNARNLSTLTQQIIPIGILSLAAVLVILLGEIDLSLASVAATCAAVTAVLSVYHDWNPWLAMLAGLLSGTVIGLITGFFVAILRVPSFIVTLAGSIGYAGILLYILNGQSTLIINDSTIRALSPTYLDDRLGLGLPIVTLLIYIGAILYDRQSRNRKGLKTRPLSQYIAQIGLTTIVLAFILYYFRSYQGVPLPVVIWLGLILFFWLILKKSAFGRHLYAVGGNVEAARRAGINVIGLKIAVFAISSTLAAFSGIMLASRSTAVATQISSTLLLNAIAATVIGGVSLFGGRGSVWSVIMGVLVIGSLDNGLALLNQDQSIVNMVQGGVLLLAVTADALVRRAGAKTGR